MPDKVFNFFVEQWFAIFLFLISVYIAYWFWRNPIDTNTKKRKIFEDGDTTYISAVSYDNSWIVKKIITQNIERQLPYKFRATKRNNPGVKDAPDKIDELKKLNYEEC